MGFERHSTLLSRNSLKPPKDVFMGQYHIISLSGTLSCNYGADLKIALADEEVGIFTVRF